MDAVYYGPSLAGDEGLGLLTRRGPNILECTASGRQLASAFDAVLAKHRVSSAFRQSANHADEARAKRLYGALRIDAPSKEEAQVLRKVLFDPRQVTEQTSRGYRSAAIELIRIYLGRYKDGLTAEQLRRELTLDFRPGEPKLPAPLHEAQAKWAALQVRQGQRLALELMYAWCERKLFELGGASSFDIAESLYSAVTADVRRPETYLESQLASTLRRFKDKGNILKAAKHDQELDVVSVTEHLESLVKTEKAVTDGIAQAAFRLLVLCVPYRDVLSQDAVAAQFLGGSPFRLPLGPTSAWLASAAGMPFSKTIQRIVERWLIAQHLWTATVRIEEGRQIHRISKEDEGYVCLFTSKKALWLPNVAPDRLRAALSLSAECRILQRTNKEDRYVATQ